MSPAHVLQFPAGWGLLVGVMLWPAVWAATAMTIALGEDVIRLTKKAHSHDHTPARIPTVE